ncbi:efflux RND transporter periplasmic adaptor subunit [Microvirga rosea]|uniref:efflux RND transporter periplasmic adaptor subunit n=1 Tax=Microvirga rosea TaxID=2715425 RepID=UPI001D09EE63|nr:HlyD family efflux transporter periplasmic adaptor subunit [Microvirga rosea]MCB8820581.1 HlyD family efflux transporter periplasmic adaptor subunit [Microvirga rosea]
MSEPQARQLLRMTLLVQLEGRARNASLDELMFVMVNETHAIVPYRQALLWRNNGRQGKVAAVSGLSSTDPHSPFLAWIGRIAAHWHLGTMNEIRAFQPSDLPEALAQEWSEWLPPQVLWVPLGDPSLGGLLLAREEPWATSDTQLLDILRDCYGHAWMAHLSRRGLGERLAQVGPTRYRVLAGGAALLIMCAGFIPVRQSVLAPAEIIPRDPAVIRAPLEGVIETVAVRPNEAILEGQVLFTLDPRRLENQLEIARRAREVAEAELRQARQLSVADQKARASLPVLQGKLDQQAAEAAYLTDQLSRIVVKSPKDGLAVFDDPNEWLGRPVAIGERVMQVADPKKVEIEVRLPVADAIDLDAGAPVRLFLNSDPENPRDGTLTFASYRAQRGADNLLTFRIKAQLSENESPLRIGLKGTAKLYGEQVTLAYYLFRRPIAAARQWLGL